MAGQNRRERSESSGYYEYMETLRQSMRKEIGGVEAPPDGLGERRERNSPVVPVTRQRGTKRNANGDDTSSDEEENPSEGESQEINNQEGNVSIIEIKQLRIWALQYQIPPAHLEPLLVILRARLLPSLPRSAKIFLDDAPPPPAKKRREEATEKNECCSPAILKEILKKLVSIETDVKKNRETLANIEDCLQVKDDFVSADFSIPTKHEIELPINSVNALLHFEQKLTDDRRCLSDTLQVMKRLKSSKVSISATSILRKFLGRTVATQYTATKKMTDKLVMETHVPKFMGCVLEALMATHEGLSDKEAKAAVGTALTQSKGWDGQRSEKNKKLLHSSMTVIKEEEDILDADSIMSNTWMGERFRLDTSASE
ncbi:uncharacterized protein LOC107038865 isoform X1 [Diachasma alloeum]|uniref:uncharacterized protein LOC107038865 isoform X1 n=1 Tax=Diachasma alloeum TaxID=454923 RepID=UPI0007383B7F|nr:uncharacterized protein LOC107038865 isoform X1 [Diachasma alloeum]